MLSTDATHSETVARERIIRWVLRRVASEREDPSSSYAAELEYCDDELDSAARALVAALDAKERV